MSGTMPPYSQPLLKLMLFLPGAELEGGWGWGVGSSGSRAEGELRVSVLSIYT